MVSTPRTLLQWRDVVLPSARALSTPETEVEIFVDFSANKLVIKAYHRPTNKTVSDTISPDDIMVKFSALLHGLVKSAEDA